MKTARLPWPSDVLPAEFPARPWLITHGNTSLWQKPKLALFCSNKCPGDIILSAHDWAGQVRQENWAVISGFHSAIEKECLTMLARGNTSLVYCPARSIENMRLVEPWTTVIAKDRGLIVSPFAPGQHQMSAEAAIQRNVFVAAVAKAVLIVHAAPGGKLMELSLEFLQQKKPVFTFAASANESLLSAGAVIMPKDLDW